MKELRTEIIIDSKKEKIWEILMDFDRYPEWNPFVISLKGRALLGETLSAHLQNPDSKPMKFNPKVTKLRKNEVFSWLGHLFFTGLFDGHHIYEIEEISENRCKFIQREEFSGILVGIFWNTLNTKTRAGFESMNAKLKERAELQS